MDKETREIVEEIKGLDNIGRPDLKYAIGKIDNIEKLPWEVEDVVDAFYDIAEDKDEKEMLIKILRVLTNAFESGMEDGYGADLYEDKNGNINLEVDNLRVRNRMAVKEFLRQQIRATNGNIFVSSTGKVRYAVPSFET